MRAVLFFLAGASCCVSSAWAADIYFTDVPPYGTDGNLSGQVRGVFYNDYKVLTYIYVWGWWNKPTWANPLTPINGDGSWTCDITTGGISDTYATTIISFLVPNGSYQPSWEMAGDAFLPAELYVYPYVDIHRTPATRTIEFAGHNWAVKFGNNLGPGPNNFSDSADNVWIDGNGYLHLKITHPDGQWYCSEIISDESFGYGTYVFTIDSRVTSLDTTLFWACLHGTLTPRNIIIGRSILNSAAGRIRLTTSASM